MSNNSRLIKTILTESSNKADWYLEKIKQHQTLLMVCRSALPFEMKEQLTACVLKNSTLILYTDSASWATKLRFYQDSILQALATEGFSYVVLTKFRILPQAEDLQKNIRIPKQPSTETLERMEAEAKHNGNPQIKASLLALVHSIKRFRRNESRY
ncbi:MAG: DciA family protein [Methylococcaceae bacterium]